MSMAESTDNSASPSGVFGSVPTLDLAAIESKWLRQCGVCDAGLPEYGCTHPSEDYRPVMLSLVTEIERLRRLLWDSIAESALATVESYLGPVERRDAGRELLHICYGCQEEIAVADQRVVTMPDAIEYWHDRCVNG